MDNIFDIDFKLLPPELQLKLWILALDADTSKVNLAYKPGQFRTNLTYNYGGNIEASIAIRQFSGTVKVNPGNGAFDLGLVYRGFRFNSATNIAAGSTGVNVGFKKWSIGSSANFAKSAFGLTLNYGAELLPFPADLADTFGKAANGLQNTLGSLGAAPTNPLAWYKMRSNDIDTITSAIDTGKKLMAPKNKGPSFGGNVRLNYAPQTGLVIYCAVQAIF
jgi:hypothetical protein